MFVAQDLHLDVAGAQDHLFQIALAVAKGGLGLAAAFQHLFFQLVGAVDRTHAPTTAAPGRFQHQRIADLGSLGADRVHIGAQHFGRRDHRHTGLDRHTPRAGLVAKGAHGFGLGTDKGDARRVAGIDEIGVFRQQAVPGVDRVGTRHAGHADDFLDAQIGRDRPHAFANAISFVRLEPVQPQLVLFGKDGHRLFAHLVGGPHDADGDFTTVGDENFGELSQGGHPYVSNDLMVFTQGVGQIMRLLQPNDTAQRRVCGASGLLSDMLAHRLSRADADRGI